MKRFLLLASMIFSATAFANGGECNNCTIDNLGYGPHYDSVCKSDSCVFIMMLDPVTTRPQCAEGKAWHFVLDTSTDSGKATLSALMAARAMNEKINIKGTGSCTGTNDNSHESMLYMYH